MSVVTSDGEAALALPDGTVLMGGDEAVTSVARAEIVGGWGARDARACMAGGGADVFTGGVFAGAVAAMAVDGPGPHRSVIGGRG